MLNNYMANKACYVGHTLATTYLYYLIIKTLLFLSFEGYECVITNHSTIILL